MNAVVDERDADMGQGAVYHDNLVELSPCAGPQMIDQLSASLYPSWDAAKPSES